MSVKRNVSLLAASVLALGLWSACGEMTAGPNTAPSGGTSRTSGPAETSQDESGMNQSGSESQGQNQQEEVPSPTPSQSATPIPEESPTPAPEASPTASPTPSPSATPSPTPSPSPTASPTPAATPTTVSVSATQSLQFSPASINIKVGDTVVWTNTATVVHTVTDDPTKAQSPADAALPAGATAFDSGDIVPGSSFSKTFTVPGQYKYFCKPHETLGMLGTINVSP